MMTMRSAVGAAPVFACVDCAAPLGFDQRYCVDCGARRGELPTEISRMIGALAAAGGGGRLAPGGAPGPAAATAAAASWPRPSGRPAGAMPPTPRAAALATMCTLAFGVAVGRAATPAARPDGRAALLAALAPSFVAAGGAGRLAAAAPAPAPPVNTATPTPAAAAAPAPAASPAPASAPTPKPKPKPAPAPAPAAPTVPVAAALPAVKHVFLIVLTDHGLDAAFGPGSPAPYLAATLRHQGELLPNYYAVTSGELANEIALISGQGPSAQTAADCPQYVDLVPGTIGAQGQAVGAGCVYPAAAKTLPDELAAGGQGWRAYVEGIGGGAPGTAQTCRHPAAGAGDPAPPADPTSAYVTWRNPFVYFQSLIDGSACKTNDVGLDRLAPDLAVAKTAPSFAYIVPDRCHDGSELPCAPGQPAGLVAADAFLRTLVPQIVGSAAYQDGGLIAITFDQAPQAGPAADASACCLTPTAYPSLAAGAAPPGASGASGTTTTPAPYALPVPPATTTTTTTAPYALPVPPSTTTTTTTTAPYAPPIPPSTTTAPASTTTDPTTFPVPQGVRPAGGGGRVGLLLISSFVTPGSVDPTAYSHFSLLASVQDLFGLPNIGYAGISGLPVFGASVYNAKP